MIGLVVIGVLGCGMAASVLRGGPESAIGCDLDPCSVLASGALRQSVEFYGCTTLVAFNPTTGQWTVFGCSGLPCAPTEPACKLNAQLYNGGVETWCGCGAQFGQAESCHALIRVPNQSPPYVVCGTSSCPLAFFCLSLHLLSESEDPTPVCSCQ